MKKIIVTALVSAALFSTQAYAQPHNPRANSLLSNNYGVFAFEKIDIDVDNGKDLDGDGFFFGGSHLIKPNLAIVAHYGTADVDDVDADVTAFSVGFNHIMRKSADTDLLLGGGFIKSDIDRSNGSDESDNGFEVHAQLNHLLKKDLMASVAIEYVNLDGGDFGVDAAATYRIEKEISLTGGIDISDDATAFHAGIRYYY